MELSGKTALVTGASRGIGKQIAIELGRRGADIVVAARTVESRKRLPGTIGETVDAVEEVGATALAVQADMASAEDLDRLVRETMDRFGRIDILVNNAAIRREEAFAEMPLTAWREILATILDGAFICAQACLPQLAASGAGAVVNIGGLTAHLGANRRAHVVTAKAGLVGLTRALAHELAAQNVTVNCVSPGRIATARRGPEPNAHRVPSLTGTAGAPDDIAATVRFLAGPRARYVTGQTIHVNGGAYLSS
jgi:3-oxoacyl-[acyl-carrier protein] reductase